MLPPSIEKYVADLAGSYADIQSIWLFGSRANGTSHRDSDWDFLVFDSGAVLISLRSDTRFHRSDVDLLIVHDGDQFEKPWGRPKSGTLSSWQWQRQSEQEAMYRATKAMYNEDDKEEFNVRVTDCRAVLVYERA